MNDTWAIEAHGLGKRYRRGWALRDCSFRIPAGRICGLVGPNGAGKSTLLNLAARLRRPTAGSLRLFGTSISDPEAILRMAFLPQDKPLFKRFTVEETLRLGRELNPGWDQTVAERIVGAGNIPLHARVGTLSGGQRTRVAFALAFGKRPNLLVLDEPMADLDPLARHETAATLMAETADSGTTVVMSSHLLGELADMCDYLVLLCDGRIRLAGDVDELLPAHRLITGTGAHLEPHTVVESRTTGRQTTALIRPEGAIAPSWAVAEPCLEDVLLAYLRAPAAPVLMTDVARVPEPAVAA
ncbi:ABC transporter ATP-binding protein [Embleya scabrispora]|uniref:ABC transporter ATP-binding protein n=1 Tax=Embleya scabrispora TaxID=159449 RepID=UPI0003668617|nr:ABC transporter ATP-binding protein [Embleya scabrispora]MYS84061.1 ATP-binding cassette domain-containing protein [Streptomyces sp. SID5474]